MNPVDSKNNPAGIPETALVEAKNLKKYFLIRGKGNLHAVDNISFRVNQGETVGLVGESGCGKSTVGNLIMRLLPKTDGQLLFRGKNIFEVSKQEHLEYCRKMQIIFQDPFSSLNPKKSIRDILGAVYRIQRIAKGRELDKLINNLCDMVEIPKSLLSYFPHELDGGMRQVVGIARALSMNPEFIVCDEPVSSLDVSIQAKIINLLIDMQKEKNLSYLFISHDLSVVRHISKQVAIMYLGQIVEMADTDRIFEKTMHPYSIALLSAIPVVDVERKVVRIILKGDVPSPMDPKPGCRFAPRCWMAKPECTENDPPLTEVEEGHYAACYFASESRERMLKAETLSLK